MAITEADIRQMIAGEETGSVEFKIEAPRPGELAERICGMANARSGGTILFGIEDATRRPVGLARPHATIDLIWKAVRLIKPVLALAEPGPEVVAVDGVPLVALRVPGNGGPLYQAGGTFWIRKGSATVPLTVDEIERHLNVHGSVPWERRLAGGATLDDLDPALLDAFLAKRGEGGRRTRRYVGQDDLLTGLHAAGPDPLTGVLRPTHAGILLFGRDPQAFIPQSEMVCVRYGDSLGVGGYLDRKTLTGTLPEIIDQAAMFLTVNVRVGAQIRGFQRQDQPEYPVEALREAVVNAIAHRDYSADAESIRLFYYPDRIEIHSPGLLPPGLTPADLAEMRAPSRPRNRLIAQLLRDLPGYMEQIGSGIRLMVHEMRRLGLPDPEFVEQHEFVVIFRNGHTLTGEPGVRLSPRQLQALRIVQEKGSINTPEFVATTGASERTALYDLRDLVDRGILVARGKARNVRYYIP